MDDMGVYLAFDVDYISMIPTGGELVACRHSVKVDDEDLAGAYELIRKLYQEVRIERDNLKRENVKLRLALKALTIGTVAELCDDADAAECKGCAMRHDDYECAVTDAMELLGIGAHGEPMEVVKA